jgi:hypothetical protein
MNRRILPELEFISCTSGASHRSSRTWRERTSGRRPKSPSRARAGDLASPQCLYRPLASILVTLFTGVPNVFGPWAEAFAAHVTQRAIGFFDRTSPYHGIGNLLGAENPDTASGQRDRRQPADPAPTVGSPCSVISRCGLPTRIPGIRPHADLAGTTRPIRRGQGRRDPGTPSRDRRASPTQLLSGTPHEDVASLPVMINCG